MLAKRQKRLSCLHRAEAGATTVEYAIAIIALALAVLLVAGFLEASIAGRVNSGRDCYTTVELQDPAATGGRCQ